jgi:hypothetical protein
MERERELLGVSHLGQGRYSIESDRRSAYPVA